jgi:hypothetical protein
MIRVAVSIFKSRVSPVFDTYTRLVIIDFAQGKEIQRQEIYLGKLSLSERVPNPSRVECEHVYLLWNQWTAP